MADPKPVTGRKLLVAGAFSLGGGIIGALLGRLFGATLHTSSAWVGPAIAGAVITLLLLGSLLLPTAIRTIRSKGRDTAA